MADVAGGVVLGVVDSHGSAQYGYAENGQFASGVELTGAAQWGYAEDGGVALGAVIESLSSMYNIGMMDAGRITDPDTMRYVPVGGA